MDKLNSLNKKLLLICVTGLILALAACGPGGTTEAPFVQPTTESPDDAAGALATSTAPPADAPADAGAYPAPEQAAQAAYPAVEDAAIVEPYPADGQPVQPQPTNTPEGYPAATVEVFLEPRFRIDQPLTAGATVVKGQAPPGVPIAVLDVTFGGALLGSGAADADGRFSITVAPLDESNRIGITVGALEEGQDLAGMAETYFPYRGEGFMNIPNVGILFDTALVQSE